MDATAQLLEQAIADAISYQAPDVPWAARLMARASRAKCWPDWRQASAYEALWSELGIVADGPRRKPRLRVAGDARVTAQNLSLGGPDRRSGHAPRARRPRRPG